VPAVRPETRLTAGWSDGRLGPVSAIGSVSSGSGGSGSGGLGPRVWAAMAVVYVVWGSTYLAIRYAVQTLPPLLHAAFRFTLAGLLLTGWVAVRARSQLRIGMTRAVTAAASGVLMLTLGNGLVSVGEEHVPSGVTALIVASVPLWVVLLRAVLADRPARVTALGVVLGFAGVALLFRPGGGFAARSAGLIVLASFTWAVGTLVVSRRPVPADPLVLSAVQMLAGGAALFAFSGVGGEFGRFHPGEVSARSWLALAYLVTAGSLLAFTAYVWLLGQAPVSVVTTNAYVNPAVAVALGVLFAGEHLSGGGLVGGLLILVAVALVVTSEGRVRRRARAAAIGAPPPTDLAA
jgi:drug/metabolite transporter (DMT)-like permease